LEMQLGVQTKYFLLDKLVEVFDWHQLTALWRIHACSYISAGSKSEKFKQLEWVTHQSKKMEQLNDPAQKFQQQLQRLFAQEKLDLEHVKSRVKAAFDYFFKVLDEVYFSLLKTMNMVIKKPKIKAYIEELEVIEEQHLEVILNLKKMIVFIEKVIENGIIDKRDVWNEEITKYRITKKALAIHENRLTKSSFDFNDQLDYEQEIVLKPLQKKKEKSKISTYEQTLILLKEGNTVSEISTKRLLGESTIYNHIAKLIQEEKIAIQQIFSEDKLEELENVFKKFDNENITSIKEKTGNKFSWDELKLFKASLIV
jgi:hypothetical protein